MFLCLRINVHAFTKIVWAFLPQNTEGIEKAIFEGSLFWLCFRCLTIEAAPLLPGVLSFLLAKIANTPDR